MWFSVFIIYLKTSKKKLFMELQPESLLSYGARFPLVVGLPPNYPKYWLPPHCPPLLCPKNVDFVISCSFWPLCPNCPPTTSRLYLGNPVGSTLELKEHCLNKVYAICLKLFKQLFVVKSHPKIV